jgi:hypothetical protein
MEHTMGENLIVRRPDSRKRWTWVSTYRFSRLCGGWKKKRHSRQIDSPYDAPRPFRGALETLVQALRYQLGGTSKHVGARAGDYKLPTVQKVTCEDLFGSNASQTHFWSSE